MIDVSGVTAELDKLANEFIAPDVGPYYPYTVVTSLNTTKITLRMLSHPFYIRLKIKQIEKSARIVGNGLTDNANDILKIRNWKPSTRRARYSNSVANDFKNNEEFDN